MRKHTILCIIIFLSFIHNSFASNRGFAFSEHMTIGDQVKLRFANNEPGQEKIKLTLPNGLAITYGELISFGDVYGIIGKPIAHGKDVAERETRFMNAFNTFAKDPATIKESEAIIQVFRDELNLTQQAIEQGVPPEKAYGDINNEMGRRINCITGGGCGQTTWWLDQGRLLKLMQDNYDHFRNDAILAYKTGHQIALKIAADAHASHDTQKLTLAYAINAYACHFLSDRFAAGHLRTPRNRLPHNVTPSLVGSLLAGTMHNEEGKYGLHVHNLRGDQWISYGDRSYFSEKNVANKLLVNQAIQLSADEIFDTYISGVIKENDGIDNLIPYPNEVNTQNQDDISPLFYWDEKTNKLMRRSNLGNPYDRHWTANWWGWTTLVELNTIYKLTPEQQSQLIAAGYDKQAMQAGLISNSTNQLN